MKVIRQLENGGFDGMAIVLAIGFFDGVHRGHQAVISEAKRQAEQAGGEAWILTFDPHPLAVIAPDRAPALLTSAQHKCLLFKQYGMAGCIMMTFDQKLRSHAPKDFLHLLIRHIPHLAHIVVGENWTFGSGQQGRADTLRHLAAQRHIGTTLMPPVFDNAKPVSSTRIRQAVLVGDLGRARRMLGRDYSIYGHVVHGREVGRELGYPTANVHPCNEVHPPDGIYAARAAVGETTFDAAAYIGSRPTFEEDQWVVEVFLPGEHLDLYDREIEISFVEKIRDDCAFESVDALKAQITRDVAAVRQILGKSQGESA